MCHAGGRLHPSPRRFVGAANRKDRPGNCQATCRLLDCEPATPSASASPVRRRFADRTGVTGVRLGTVPVRAQSFTASTAMTHFPTRLVARSAPLWHARVIVRSCTPSSFASVAAVWTVRGEPRTSASIATSSGRWRRASSSTVTMSGSGSTVVHAAHLLTVRPDKSRSAGICLRAAIVRPGSSAKRRWRGRRRRCRSSSARAKRSRCRVSAAA
ncbi:MAG: hypothetical protein JWR63_4403 [Conexibacter sp.]|nr:hypothetical protein [Conexibacter sp.]